MTKNKNSRLSGFYRLDVAARRDQVALWTDDGDMGPLINGGMDEVLCDKMVENAIGLLGMPVGVATNFTINGRDVLVPMAVEEPSVIAAASNAARIIRAQGGFSASATSSLTIAQVELLEPQEGAKDRIEVNLSNIKDVANQTQPELVKLGGGIREIQVRTDVGGPHRMVVHFIVDCLDAMGANMVNTMAEAAAPLLCELSGANCGLRILSNLADRRLAKGSCSIHFDELARSGFSGERVAHGVASASDFASDDPYRAATHNKGIFNGIDAVLIATGNDWRAVEAGGHAYAARNGRYEPLATWRVHDDYLYGEIEMPMAVGIVGGASKTHPAARKCLEILNVNSAAQLSQVVVCAGLASNLAALAALASEGIQAGHMKLHKRRLE